MKAHVLLLVLSVLPTVVYIPYSVSVVLHAALTVYVGSWRSIKAEPPQESMTHKDAMKFPIVGSCVLFGLFLCFRYLPKWLVNLLLSGYITLLGAFAINAVALPFVNQLFSEATQKKVLKLPSIPAIPFVSKEPTPLELTVPELLLCFPSLALGVWYAYTKNWLANNALGLAFSLLGIESVSLGSFKTAAILLSGLFVYDIFWVFCTPVMVSVAKNFEAPIKLLFPRESLRAMRAAAAAGATAKPNFAMLGLGDIVIPGLFVALMLRYDAETNFKSNYFQSVFWGYVGGLGTTIFVMNYFKAAQPALLYIVPAVLLTVAAHAALRGEFGQVWHFQEDHVVQQEAADAAAAAGKEGEDKKEQ
uniref:Signal peptide peptidase n=1 Tax=Tetradesmus obliquus TaxID=3088 RepID=A0A383WFE3_TETOB|eukprot:jgi/Sobl393_1/18694/SZX75973.1